MSVRRAYWVDESRHGITHYLVYARTAKEAIAKVKAGDREDVETMDWGDDPGGIRSVRRAPEEDRK